MTEFTLRDVLGEARVYLWFALFTSVFGLFLLLAELRSPDLVMWTGHCVPASFDGGIAHYTVGGQPFTADNPPQPDRSPRMVTVCYDPSDPGNGYIVRPAGYWVEGGLIGGTFGLALVLVAVGMTTGVRRLRKASDLPPLPTR
ncbi:MAG TPA: hypothetical protein VM674_06095 [Candidatus Acidoferrum sp.]|nr:hypothetical protein [Candidatus Acidoferrum sp.]